MGDRATRSFPLRPQFPDNRLSIGELGLEMDSKRLKMVARRREERFWGVRGHFLGEASLEKASLVRSGEGIVSSRPRGALPRYQGPELAGATPPS